jgi:hypothetical protein
MGEHPSEKGGIIMKRLILTAALAEEFYEREADPER